MITARWRHCFFLCCVVGVMLCTSLPGWSRGGGGCFLPNTPILLANGNVMPIQQIRSGDLIRAYKKDGSLVNSTVEAIIKHQVDAYFVLTSQSKSIKVTGEHPFYVGNGQFKQVRHLHEGEVIFTIQHHSLHAEPIIRLVKVKTSTQVFNLKTSAPHTYFAAGIAVHNKGGGGGGGGGGGFSGRGGRGGSLLDPYFWMFFILFYIGQSAWEELKKRFDVLNFSFSKATIQRKAAKTVALLKFLAVQDRTMDPTVLQSRAREVFTLLQECWTKRDYLPMQPLLMPDLYRQHCGQIAGMIRNYEINRIDRLLIQNVDLVNVRYTEKEYQREFTALITASARDYYVDDRTMLYLRGDNETESFQEFWTFQLQDGNWLLREIEQTSESDCLKDENFVEQFTDGQVAKIYQDAVDNLGAAGPGLSKQVQAQSTKVERMLNFLVKSDRIWDKQAMLSRVRLIFTDVHMALEAGNFHRETQVELFPAVAEKFMQTLAEWKAAGNTIEYRNFCVRKVDILLVKSFEDKSQNEFLARITAHAQRIQTQNGNVLTKDDDVTPFEEFWTFGLLDGQWKLKDALPKADGKKAMDGDNIEEGSTADLVKWYYTKKRAL